MRSVFVLLVHSFLLVVSLSGCGIVGLKGKLTTRTAGESQALESNVLKHTIAGEVEAPPNPACTDPELPCPAPVPAGGSGPVDYEPNCSEARTSSRAALQEVPSLALLSMPFGLKTAKTDNKPAAEPLPTDPALRYPFLVDRNAKLVVEEVTGDGPHVINTYDLSQLGPQKNGQLRGMARVNTTVNFSSPSNLLRFWSCAGSNCPKEGTSGRQGTNVSVRTVEIQASTLAKGLVLPVWNVMDETHSTDPEQCMKQLSPLVLPGASGRIGTVPLLDGPIFQMIPGQPQHTAWIDGEASFLARDRNGNGKIDDIRELYGDYDAKSGFEALAREVSKRAATVTPDDAVWKELMLWNDRNTDGISQPDELTPISRSNVAKISLSAVAANETDRFGVSTKWRSTFQRTDGTYQVIADLYFTVSSAR